MGLRSKHYSLCVIIPMYNEERGAARCIEAIIPVIRNQKVPVKLLVINDGSKDKTETILLEKKKLHPQYLIIVTYKKNKGYGGALQEGIKEGLKQNFTYGLFMDSDLTNDPKFITDFVKTIPKEYDCVKASRFTKKGRMVGVPLKRKFFSVFGNLIASSLFGVGIKDCTNGFRMVRLSLLKDIHFKENSFPIILEELYYLKKQRATFYEIPTVLTSRTDTKSNFRYTPNILFKYFSYALKASIA